MGLICNPKMFCNGNKSTTKVARIIALHVIIVKRIIRSRQGTPYGHDILIGRQIGRQIGYYDYF